MPPGILFSLILLGLVVIGGASIVLHTIENGISPSPTPPRVRRAMLEMLRDLPVPGPIYELGSGWGSLALPVARAFPKSQVIGLEKSPVPFVVSAARNTASGLRNLTLRREDFMACDLSDAALLIVYQSPGNMMNLRPKLEAELSDDAWVLSNTFALPGWNANRTIQLDDLFRTRLYLYRAGDARPLRRSENTNGQP